MKYQVINYHMIVVTLPSQSCGQTLSGSYIAFLPFPFMFYDTFRQFMTLAGLCQLEFKFSASKLDKWPRTCFPMIHN